MLEQRGYKYLAQWSDDSGDSLGQDVEYQKGVMGDAAAQAPGPRMVLQHSTSADGTSCPLWLSDRMTWGQCEGKCKEERWKGRGEEDELMGSGGSDAIRSAGVHGQGV